MRTSPRLSGMKRKSHPQHAKPKAETYRRRAKGQENTSTGEELNTESNQNDRKTDQLEEVT